jgi:hypothetical protein
MFFGETSGERTSVPPDGSETVRREICRPIAIVAAVAAADVVVKLGGRLYIFA